MYMKWLSAHRACVWMIRLSMTFRHKLMSHSFTTVPPLFTRGLSSWSSELPVMVVGHFYHTRLFEKVLLILFRSYSDLVWAQRLLIILQMFLFQSRSPVVDSIYKLNLYEQETQYKALKISICHKTSYEVNRTFHRPQKIVGGSEPQGYKCNADRGHEHRVRMHVVIHLLALVQFWMGSKSYVFSNEWLHICDTKFKVILSNYSKMQLKKVYCYIIFRKQWGMKLKLKKNQVFV